MKRRKLKKTEIILIIVLFPIFLLLLLGLLITTPIDYIRYKCSRYFKDTKERYSWLSYSSYYVKLYDTVKKHGLPIDYYRCDSVKINGYGFFIYNDTLILNDYEPSFDIEKEAWTDEIEDEYVPIEEEAKRRIKECNEALNREACIKAVLLIDEDLYNEHPDVKCENVKVFPVANKYDDIASFEKMLAQIE